MRDRKGNEVFEEVDQPAIEYVDGTKVITYHKAQVKVLDDNTEQIAQAFRQWLSEQD